MEHVFALDKCLMWKKCFKLHEYIADFGLQSYQIKDSGLNIIHFLAVLLSKLPLSPWLESSVQKVAQIDYTFTLLLFFHLCHLIISIKRSLQVSDG